jgi:hypothetical protein
LSIPPAKHLFLWLHPAGRQSKKPLIRDAVCPGNLIDQPIVGGQRIQFGFSG